MSTAPRPWPSHADDLEATLAEAFRMLSRGVADRRSPCHTPTVATVGPDGAPRLRTMVLRGFDPPARTLRFHTDRRAAKAADLAADPRVAVHAYDAGAQVQLRLNGRATLHTDDAVANAAWAATRDGSRLVYAIDPAPGTPVAAPPPAPREPGEAAAQFAVLVIRFDDLEWLWLSAAGHRRARFEWPAGVLRATWQVP